MPEGTPGLPESLYPHHVAGGAAPGCQQRLGAAAHTEPLLTVHCNVRNGNKSIALGNVGLWHLDPDFGQMWDSIDREVNRRGPGCAILYDERCHLPSKVLVPFRLPRPTEPRSPILPWFLNALAHPSWRKELIVANVPG